MTNSFIFVIVGGATLSAVILIAAVLIVWLKYGRRRSIRKPQFSKDDPVTKNEQNLYHIKKNESRIPDQYAQIQPKVERSQSRLKAVTATVGKYVNSSPNKVGLMFVLLFIRMFLPKDPFDLSKDLFGKPF